MAIILHYYPHNPFDAQEFILKLHLPSTKKYIFGGLGKGGVHAVTA
jgi:hypothetical protein